jgi:phosphoenolpyruvate carboxylase
MLTVRRRIKAILERLWRTGEILLAKPEVADERRQSVIISAKFSPTLSRNSIQDFARRGTMPVSTWATCAKRCRDCISGHGSVATAMGTHCNREVTQETLIELRLGALIVLDRMLERLAVKMSLSIYGQTPPPNFWRNERLSHEAGSRAAPILAQDEEEPWRQFVRLMKAKMPLDTRADEPVCSMKTDFIVSPRSSKPIWKF